MQWSKNRGDTPLPGPVNVNSPVFAQSGLAKARGPLCFGRFSPGKQSAGPSRGSLLPARNPETEHVRLPIGSPVLPFPGASVMNITPKDLLDAGVHFGHQTKRWNPRFKDYLFDHRQGISIIDLTKTHERLEKTCQFVENLVADGGDVLFVGTKRQAQEIVREAATSTNMPFCANRWMGGTLTNFETIKRSIAKYKRYMEMEASGELAKMHKKEASAIKREMGRMLRNFEGLVGLNGLPAAMIVVDVNYEDIAVAEGRRVNMAVIGLVDTNSDPGTVDHPIPGNDDAVKSIRIILETLVESIQAGLSQRDSRRISRGQQQVMEAQPIAAPVQPIIPAAAPVEPAAPTDEPTTETPPTEAPTDDEVAVADDFLGDENDPSEDDDEATVKRKAAARKAKKMKVDEDSDSDEEE